MREQTIKIVILGDCGVGKSSLALRFVSNEFKPYSESTIGASYMSKSVTFDYVKDANNEDKVTEETILRKIDFKIWDTAGQEKYRSLAPMYYRGAGAALLVYDVSKATSFEVLQSWVDELKSNGPPGIVLGLCGNKCDLDDDRQVQSQDAQDYANRLGCFYLETSAKNDVNVHKAFEEIAKKVPLQESCYSDPVEGTGSSIHQLDLGLSEEYSTSYSSSCC